MHTHKHYNNFLRCPVQPGRHFCLVSLIEAEPLCGNKLDCSQWEKSANLRFVRTLRHFPIFPATLLSWKPASEKAQAPLSVYETSLGGCRAQSGQTTNCTATSACLRWKSSDVQCQAVGHEPKAFACSPEPRTCLAAIKTVFFYVLSIHITNVRFYMMNV